MEIPIHNSYGVAHAGTVPIVKGNPVRVFATQEAVHRTGAPGSVRGILLQSGTYVLMPAKQSPRLDQLKSLTVTQGRLVPAKTALTELDAAAADTLEGRHLRDVRWGGDACHVRHGRSEKIGKKDGRPRESWGTRTRELARRQGGSGMMRGLVFFAAACLALAGPLGGQNSSGSAGHPASEARLLKPGKRLERTLAGGEKHIYAIRAKRGQFIHAIVDQLGIDVALTLYAPDDKPVGSMDSFNGNFGPEQISTIAEAPGIYRLEVASGDKNVPAGRYRVTVEPIRAPSDRDHARITAERILSEAVQLQEQGSADSLRIAIQKYLASLPLWRTAGDRYEEALTQDSIEAAYFALGEKQKALDYANQALPLMRGAADRAGEALTLSSIGSVYDALGEKQKALDYYNQALPLRRAVGDRQGEAITLSNIGRVYATLGEKQKALDYYNQALPLERAVGDRAGEAATLTNIGIAYSALGEMQKALDYFNQALPLMRAVGDRTGEAATLHNIGWVYGTLGEKQQALDYYNQALSLKRTVGDREGEARTLDGIGGVYSALGEKQKALDYYNQALPLLRAVGDRAGEASALISIGRVYSALGEQKALDYYNQALPLKRAVGDREGEARTLDGIGLVYDSLGEKQKALDYYNQALPLMRAVGDRADEAVTLGNLRDHFAKSHPDLAIVFGKQAINVLQSIRRDNQGLEQGLRHSYEKSIDSQYRSLAELLIGRSRFGEAEEVLDLLKDKEAADFIRRDAVADQLKPATLLDSEGRALERYEQILTQIVSEGEAKSALVAKSAKTALNGEESARVQQLDRDLSAANTILLRFFDEEEKTFAANSAAAKRVGELRESEGLQDALQALGPDVVAIYTLVVPDKYTALLVTSGARKAYVTVIAEVELNRKIFDFRQQLQNPASNPLPLARELYQILFPEGLRQDLDRIGAKTIMWSIDSTIRYVPIAALHDGQQYLVARFRNSLITPASLTRLTEGSDTVWKGVGFGVSQAHGNFTALPAVPAELHRIFRQGETGDAPVAGPVKLDGDFTRETFEAAMRRPEKLVVHIATHFDSQPGVAANSHLLLGDGSEMSLAEIEATPRLFSGVDLLTLSACSTAFTNRTEDGREVDSFGTIAQRLGARGVIASLWSVSDEATTRLMERMYRIRQTKPELGKSEALRQAQEEMAAGVLKPEVADAVDRGVHVPGGRAGATGWTHPYYWAPFILIGNWK